MYSAFYLQPKIEKEKRIIRCDPFVKDYTVAVFILRVQRRKNHTGGVIVGDVEALTRFWNTIEANDGNFPDDMEQVKNILLQLATMCNCQVAYLQESQEPSFANIEDFVSARSCMAQISLNSFLEQAVEDGIVAHVNPSVFFDMNTHEDTNSFQLSRFAAGCHADSMNRLVDYIKTKYPEESVASFDTEDGVNISVSVTDDISLHIMQGSATQDRMLVSASFFLSPNNKDFFDVENTSIVTAREKFQELVTSSNNVFVPKNQVRGVLTPRSFGKPDVIPFDLTMESSDTKILPVLNALFMGPSRGARGAVLAYGIKDGNGRRKPSMLFVLKGSALTSEESAQQYCIEVINERYKVVGEQEAEAPQTPTGVPQQGVSVETTATEINPVIGGMAYFKFRT